MSCLPLRQPPPTTPAVLPQFTHHLWLLGNHRPEVSTGGFAFWRRIRLIPFTRTVPANRRIDNHAFELVRDEGPGILHWLIEGARRYLATRDPLEGPGRVRIASSAYATTEEHIGRFLTECCTRPAEASTDTELRDEQGLLYAAYTAWCNAGEGVRAATARAFATRVRQELNLGSPADVIKPTAASTTPASPCWTANDHSRHRPHALRPVLPPPYHGPTHPAAH